jgi:imidazolonepropionase-like amidohydrolase
VLGALLLSPRLHAQTPSRFTALVDVNVVDVVRANVVPHQSILIDSNRIAWVGPAARQRLPAGTRVVRGGGYVIPGLWDMHIHVTNHAWARSTALPDSVLRLLADYYRDLLLASGVTGIRDMGGDLAELRGVEARWRSSSAAPRLLGTGQKLGSSPTVPGAPFPLTDAASVRRSIELVLAAGATHVKLGGLGPAELREALAECTRIHTRCSSHVSREIPVEVGAGLGMASYEHLFMLPENTSSIPFDTLVAWRTESRAPTLLQRIQYRLHLRRRQPDPADTARATHDSVKAVATFRAVASAGTYLTPTLVLHDLLSRVTDRDQQARDVGLMLEQPTAGLRGETRTVAQFDLARKKYELAEGLVRELHRAGVPLLAGTDTPIQHVPGLALWDELSLLVRAGLTPGEALRTATVNPARYLAADSLGAIAAGKVADLVLLRSNPLSDIVAVRQIELVAANGRVLPRPALDSLMADARRALLVLRRYQAPPEF